MKLKVLLLLFILIISSISVTADLTTSLTHYYKLDGDTDDAVSGGVDASADTSTNAASGKINQGRNTAVTDFIDYTNSNTFDPNGNNFSVSVWIKGTTDTGMVISKNDDNLQGWYIFITSGHARFNLEDGNIYARATTTGINMIDGNWHHIIGTFDSTNGTVKVFVDGIYRATATNAAVTDPSDTTAVFSIGSRVFTSSRIEYTGIIDEVGIWQRQLTGLPVSIGDTATGEIAELYNSGSGFQYPFSSGWTGNILGATNPSYVLGVSNANIASVMGVI